MGRYERLDDWWFVGVVVGAVVSVVFGAIVGAVVSVVIGAIVYAVISVVGDTWSLALGCGRRW